MEAAAATDDQHWCAQFDAHPDPKVGILMDFTEALGYLIAGHINQIRRQPEGCCPQCCGPCSALKYLSGPGQVVADIAMESITPIASNGYGWQYPNREINWNMVERSWQISRCPNHEC
jgi:hypothetical protein